MLFTGTSTDSEYLDGSPTYGKTGKMADSASEFESDTSSIDGGTTVKLLSPCHLEQLNKRIDSLQQENRVLRMELDTYKLRCKSLQENNHQLRQVSVTIVSLLPSSFKTKFLGFSSLGVLVLFLPAVQANNPVPGTVP